MKKIWNTVKSVPRPGIIAGIVLFALQYGLYRLGAWLSIVIGTVNNAIDCRIGFIDDLFPVIPFFVVFYIWSYVFWIMGPMAVSLTEKRNFVNYLYGLLSAYLIGFLIFTFIPTYMDRVAEGLMDIKGTDIFSKLLMTVYSADGGERAYNLVPSYHCLISTYCYLGVRKRPEISKGFQIYSLIMNILICLSTLYTKQHYIIDVVTGVGIALLCYKVTDKIDPYKRLSDKKQG